MSRGGCTWAEQLDLIQDLLSRGADPERLGATAVGYNLYVDHRTGNIETHNRLQDGTLIDIQPIEAKSALDYARASGVADVIRLFEVARRPRLMAKWRRVARNVGRIARFVRMHIYNEVVFRPGGRGAKRAREEFEAAAAVIL